MGNHMTGYSNTAPKTTFTKASMDIPLELLDRAITYHKGALVGCDGIVSWGGSPLTLTWSGSLHIYFTDTAGNAVHNSVAAGSIALSDSEFCYVTLSETADAVLTMSKAAIGAGSASAFKAYNVLVMGYRNAADDGFYPEELAGIFAAALAGGAYVEKATFDANTILKADSDNTPAALTVGTNTVVCRAAGNIEALAVAEASVVGRNTGGNVDDLTMATLRTMLGNLDGRQQQITCADSVTIDWSAGATAYMTFDRDSVALTFSNPVAGQVYRLLAKQSAGGSDVFTWTTTVKWRGGSAPTLTLTGDAIDIYTFVYINGAWYGDCALNFA